MRTNRPYVQIDPDVLERVRQIDLLSYLREFEPSNLVTPWLTLFWCQHRYPKQRSLKSTANGKRTVSM